MLLDNRWNRYCTGGGAIVRTGDGLRFLNPPADAAHYMNAQIDDYQGLPRNEFLWQPPLVLTVRARFSHPSGALGGTAGFGFWNDPFLMTGLRRPALPQVAWFFYASPLSDMALALDVPGNGWKAATMDAANGRAAAGLAIAPFCALPMHHKAIYRRLWPWFQRAFHICEAPIAAEMTEWHTYVLNWGEESVQFVVDGCEILCCSTAPSARLGLVIWLDNQWMVIRPKGKVGHGYVARPSLQWMEVSTVEVTRQ